MKNEVLNQKINNFIKKIKNLTKYDKLYYIWVGFFIFGLFLFINVTIMTLYLIDSENEFVILDNTYVNAVLPGQDLRDILQLGIVHVEEFDIENSKIGDRIVITNDFQLNVYWVETIIHIDEVSSQIKTTYDEISVSSFNLDSVVGKYISDANLIGTIYYSGSFSKGYALLSLSHILLLYGYYHIFLSKKHL